MRAVIEFVLGDNAISKSCPFDETICDSVHFAVSLTIHCCGLVISCTALYVLSSSFTHDALESLSLRKGKLSELKAIIAKSIVFALPDIALSSMVVMNLERPRDLNTISSAIIQGGWISMLLIPGLLSIRTEISVPITDILRNIAVITLALSAWTLLLPSNGISLVTCIILVIIYMLHIVSVWRTLWIQQEERDIRRESRLILQLAPMVDSIESSDILSAVPVQLVGPAEEPPLFVTLGAPRYQRLTTAEGVAHRVKAMQILEHLLSYICVRSIPGTDSQRFYIISLINSFALELGFALLALFLCEGLMERLIGGTVMRPVHAIVLAILSKTTHLIPAFLSCSDPRIIIESLDAHVVGLTIGSGLPWAFAILMGGKDSMSLSLKDTEIGFSVLSLCLLCVVSVYSLTKSRKTLFTHLGVSEGKLFIGAYACITLTAAILHDRIP